MLRQQAHRRGRKAGMARISAEEEEKRKWQRDQILAAYRKYRDAGATETIPFRDEILENWIRYSPKMLKEYEEMGIVAEKAFNVQQALWHEAEVFEANGFPGGGMAQAKLECLMLQPEEPDDESLEIVLPDQVYGVLTEMGVPHARMYAELLEEQGFVEGLEEMLAMGGKTLRMKPINGDRREWSSEEIEAEIKRLMSKYPTGRIED
jgi:hypothetical protein